MKLPEPLFRIINPTVALLLRSPLHFLVSGSLLLITFVGVRTGRSHSTPLRYMRDGEAIYCFTTPATRWWRNLRGGAPVRLTLQGAVRSCQARVIAGEPTRVRQLIEAYLSQFPQDAAYHNVAVGRNRELSAADLDRAAGESIVVEVRPD